MSSDMTSYRMSFTTGGLLLLESRAVAKLYVPGEAWAATLERARDAGATALPKVASNRRVLNEIVLRLSALSAEELAFLADEADHDEAQALLWMAICRTYRFIEEFVREVVIDRYLSYRLDLPPESFDVFFHDKAEWNDKLARLSPSTQKKLGQVMFRILREAGIITRDLHIQTAIISNRLQIMIENAQPAAFDCFPGLRRGGV